MFGTGPRSWLLPLLASALLSGCASYYRLDVGGDRAADLYTLYVLVAEENPLKANPAAASLVGPDKIGSYLLFAQFDPEDGEPLRWQEVTANKLTDLVLVSRSQDRKVLTLLVDKTLLESYKGLTVVAVGHGKDGWYAEPVEANLIRLNPGERFDVSRSKIVRRPLK
ncbi:MAG: hypothetical protein KDC98_11305 [Planctomycetes bacterium]|nr:hypothetical protein [Planctomycetota bacterium]